MSAARCATTSSSGSTKPRRRACSGSSPTAPATARWPRTCSRTRSSGRCASAAASTAAAGSAKTWLYAIALNLLRDNARRSGAEGRALERAGPAPAGGAEIGDAVEHRDVVQRALATLSPEEREAIALRFGAELTVPEIAEALREPLTTVEGRVYRALRKLRGELAE